jgi:Protein of unknown function (DUF2818)
VDVSLSSWFVILLAVCAANLPFLNERLFAIIPFGRSIKPFWVRLLELLILYLLVRSIAYLLEARIGNVFSQRWEFYAVTVCLFIVLAYPGFVFRYLRKRHG